MMISEEALYAAAPEAAEKFLSALPDREDCVHDFSPDFEARMATLLRRQRRRRHWRALLAAAAVLGALLVLKVRTCLPFLLAFAVSAGLPLLKTGGDTLAVLPVNGSTMAILFVLGIVASATMVIPGVSGSMMLMILGYYYGIINTITSFLDGLRAMDLAALKDGFLLLAPFGIGVLLGIVLIARLISFLFERYGVQTYGAILGLVLASPFAIFYNTGLFGELSSLSVWAVLLGIMLMIGGAVVTNFVGEK